MSERRHGQPEDVELRSLAWVREFSRQRARCVLTREPTDPDLEPPTTVLRPEEQGIDTPPGPRLRVLLVHPLELVHCGFKLLLREERWVERFLAAQGLEQAVELARRYRPHVAIVDLELPGESPPDLCERIHAHSPATHVLLLSNERVSAAHANAIGAAGVVPKKWPGPAIAGAARAVGLGTSVFEADVAPSRLLNERETEVLSAIAAGASNREIAERLGLSPHTVKDHASSLYRKLKARNRADAIRRAERMGLLRDVGRTDP